jgi:hypothetical protein
MTASKHMKSPIHKAILGTLVITSILSASCGENRKERAMREERELDRRALLEYQRQENQQRESDRRQREIEAGVQVLDVLTR